MLMSLNYLLHLLSCIQCLLLPYLCYVGDIIPTLDSIKLNNGPKYEVDAILYYWWVGQWHTHLEYLMSFFSYDASYNEWLPAANLANARDIFRLYQNMHRLA